VYHYFGAIKQGPDQKLYINVWTGAGLHAIDAPNNAGVNCTYIPNAIPVPPFTQLFLGLSNFPDAWSYGPDVLPYLGPDTTICGSDFTLSVPASVTAPVVWSTGSTASTINVTQTGYYWLEIPTLCNSRDSIYIVVNDLPDFSIAGDSITCGIPGTLTVNVSPGASIVWNTGETTASIVAGVPGIYSAAISIAGCPPLQTDSILVVIDSVFRTPLPEIFLTCTSEPIMLSAAYNGEHFLWSTGDTTAAISVNGSGTYWVEVTGQACPTLRDTIMVNADDCGCEVFVPNAITPNGSGLNDLFYPVFACGVSDYRLLVFDRWGNLLWESHDPAAGWNGTYKGNACQEDVYVYRITGWLDTGSNLIYYSKLGHVTIVR